MNPESIFLIFWSVGWWTRSFEFYDIGVRGGVVLFAVCCLIIQLQLLCLSLDSIMPTLTRRRYAISLASPSSSTIAAAPLSSPRPKRRRASSSDAPAAASQNYSMQGDRSSLTVANHAAVFREDARDAAKQASMDKADAARAMPCSNEGRLCKQKTNQEPVHCEAGY